MKTGFKADFFRSNRQRLKQSVDSAVSIVLTANGRLQRNNDNTYRFRQDSNFWYLTGLDLPDLILVMDGGEEYLILPERSRSQDIFDGTVDGGYLGKVSGIREVLDYKSGWKRLSASLKDSGRVGTLAPPPAYIKQHGMYTNAARRRLVTALRRRNAKLELIDIRRQLARLRMIKQPEELAAIRAAIGITGEAFASVRRALASARYEYEIEAAISACYRRARAGHAYEPIVGGGANACVLHYVENDSALPDNGLLLIDTGAEVDNYAADITRMLAVGRTSKRQRQVVETVAEVQQFALSRLKPGAIIKDYEEAVAGFMGEKLRQLGLIRSANRDNIRDYYPHATSHFLGLDVHDAADYGTPLAAGMVLTVEPGIYIPQEGIGVRIEDDVLITESGNEVLSGGLPSALS